MIAFGIALGPASARAPQITNDTTKPEEALAATNAGRAIRTDDVSVARFQFLLSALSNASGESPTDVSDKLVVSPEIAPRKIRQRRLAIELH
jgi:hypothetical protein